MPTHDPHGARAAILARLWGAADREPLPGIADRRHDTTTLTITTHHGHRLTGPRTAAALFAETPRLTITHTPPAAPPGDLTDPRELARLLATPSPHADRLATEIGNSVTGLATARAAARHHPSPEALWRTARRHHPDPSVYFEQIVVDGHPVHPLCRTRHDIDACAYAPEHHPRVHLAMTPVDTPHHSGTWPWHDGHRRRLLPVHPLQTHRHPPPAPPEHTLAAAPLMTLRTLAPYRHPHLHIKTALDIQLTSARRRVSPAATHNGPILSRTITQPGLLVQRELATLAADHHGHPSPHLAAIVRQSPTAVLPPGHIAIPLAALAQPDPTTARPLIDTVIATTGHTRHDWWHRLITTVLPPLLHLADRGIGLEAHGQNTLTALHNGHPTAVIYRDFGGIRILDTALPRLGVHTLHGDVTTSHETTVHTKLIAALYSVTLAQLVHALGGHQRWWHTVATTTARHTHGPLRDALFADTWPIKATTAMRLSEQPTTDQWTTITNPIAGLA